MIKVISLAVLIFLSGAVHAYAQMEVKVESDESADFDRLKTYAWLPESAERVHDRHIYYMLLEPRVKASADIDLQHKGYKKVEVFTIPTPNHDDEGMAIYIA